MEIFGEYKKQSEPDQAKKAENWGVAIGLQQVDDLTPSRYLLDIARENIENTLSIDEANEKITKYYQERPIRSRRECSEKEADIVSARIAKLLSTEAFSFRPVELLAIHGFLFAGLLDGSLTGKVRTYDIKKSEPVLNGESVIYGRADSIMATLEYDFEQEKRCNYARLSQQGKAEQIARFIFGIWQIHPFAEGNTRTVAVFAIRYLNTLGFRVNNDLFEKHAKYFRNALVRANYQNYTNNIPNTIEYLNKFFGNLLLGENNRLDNQEMQIDNQDMQKQDMPREALHQNVPGA